MGFGLTTHFIFNPGVVSGVCVVCLCEVGVGDRGVVERIEGSCLWKFPIMSRFFLIRIDSYCTL